MLKNLQKFYYPKSADEAVTILAEQGGRAAIVAGGTTLARLDNPQYESAVDISRCGLSYIKEDKDGLHIGATATFQELVRSETAQKFAGGLVSKASSMVSTRLVRNAGTVGGDIVYNYSYNDLPPVFLALDAKISILEKGSERWVDFTEFSTKHGTLIVGRTGLLKEVLIPLKAKNWRTSYQRFARSFSDWEAQIIVATALGFKDHTCDAARIAVGGIVQHPLRVTEAENEVLGDSPDLHSFEKAADLFCRKIDPMADWRSSKEYRKEVLKTLVRRSLQECRQA